MLTTLSGGHCADGSVFFINVHAVGMQVLLMARDAANRMAVVIVALVK